MMIGCLLDHDIVRRGIRVGISLAIRLGAEKE